MKKMTITAEMLHEVVSYDQETGKLYWTKRPDRYFGSDGQSASHNAAAWNARYAGKEAFTSIARCTYRSSIAGNNYQAHRVIWALMTGEWPPSDMQIDHINHDPLDNRWCNLRLVSRHENLRNMSLSSRNKTGVIGVGWNKAMCKWQAHIRIDGKAKHLGFFKSFDEAVSARRSAEVLAGYHKNHGTGASAYARENRRIAA